MFLKKRLKEIPNLTGVYLFKDKGGQVIYVGKALNLKERIRSYFLKQTSPKNAQLVNLISDFSFIEVTNEVEALILESNLIKKYLPLFNISLRDDKSFLYIGITGEEFPRLLAFRKSETTVKAKYKYGPFPSSQAVRNVLKMLRKIFPYCTQSPKSRRRCFYSHIGLCCPCPCLIKKEKGGKYRELRKIYLNSITNIRRILEGDIKKLRANLEKEMQLYSQKQEYEKAKTVRNQLWQIEYITKPYYKIASFLENPNFLEEERSKALQEIQQLLTPYFPNFSIPTRIEGIDISNIAGQEASGSLVVFINGQKQPNLYKRFKIKAKGPNDVSMIKEVLSRRLKHCEWQYPNLIVIDGGKPQVSQAKNVLHEDIPVIGLAKHLETIVIYNKNKFWEISLKENSGSLRLIQTVRDEAHRFAKKYHLALRKKLLRSSV